MTPRPQLQIFRSIVVTYAILVMNRFVRFELSAKHLFHNRAMFWLLMTAVSLSTGRHYVAVFVDERPRAFANWRKMGGHANALKGAIFFGLYLVERKLGHPRRPRRFGWLSTSGLSPSARSGEEPGEVGFAS